MGSRTRKEYEPPNAMALSERLSAFLDNELPEPERRAVKDMLATDPKARALLERLKLGSETGNRIFEALLDDPVPLRLMRTIRRR